MHRSKVCRAAAAGIVALALLPAGCATPGGGGGAATTAETGYPDWVRIVPEPTEGASFYVGAVSLARDVEAGIEAAETDAFDEMVEGQRRYFIDLFDRAAVDGGITTTSQERLELRTSITNEVTGRLGPATKREDVYYRYCEDQEGKQRGTVCEVYALVRLDHSERDRISRESLAAIGEAKQRAGETNMATLIEWVLRNQ
jgi:hypothetical protein